jgi:hypothetical protein
MTTDTLDRETILQVVQTWPIDEQVELADAILDHLRTASQRVPDSSFVSSETLRGIFSNGQRAPSDEEVERILRERRLQKYGE